MKFPEEIRGTTIKGTYELASEGNLRGFTLLELLEELPDELLDELSKDTLEELPLQN